MYWGIKGIVPQAVRTTTLLRSHIRARARSEEQSQAASEQQLLLRHPGCPGELSRRCYRESLHPSIAKGFEILIVDRQRTRGDLINGHGWPCRRIRVVWIDGSRADRRWSRNKGVLHVGHLIPPKVFAGPNLGVPEASRAPPIVTATLSYPESSSGIDIPA